MTVPSEATARRAGVAGGPVAELVLRWVAVSGLLGAAVVHANVLDEYLRRSWLAGVVFLALQVVQTALAFMLAEWPSPRMCRIALAVTLAALALWAVSRTTALPVGPFAGRAAPIGGAELVATALELATALVLAFLVACYEPPASRTRAATRAGAVAAVVAIVIVDYTGNRVAANALAVAEPAAAGHAHAHGGPLRPGEYPLGAPLRKPTVSSGAGFYFAAWPLRRVVVELGVGPDTKGINTFDVVVVDYRGRRVEVPDVRVVARLAGGNGRPLQFKAERLSPGHFVVHVARLARAGEWLMQVEGRRGARARPLFAHTFAVPVGEAGATS
jgi:hypothetical protein